MAITTANGQLALLELDTDWEPGLPLSPGTLGRADKQQLLWGFPEVAWLNYPPTATVVEVTASRSNAAAKTAVRDNAVAITITGAFVGGD